MPESPQPIRPIHQDDQWIIPIAGATVTLISIDYAFYLTCQIDLVDIHFCIEGPFSFRNGQEAHELDGEVPRPALAPALALFGREVRSAVADESGALELTFGDDMSIFVPPDPHYEAWNASFPGDVLLVSLPGGGVTVWMPD